MGMSRKIGTAAILAVAAGALVMHVGPSPHVEASAAVAPQPAVGNTAEYDGMYYNHQMFMPTFNRDPWAMAMSAR